MGGEKGDAFINFSSDDDARQAMVKSGSICGNPIKLFLSSRSEMQSVIAQARANPTAKPLATVSEQSYEQQEQNGANLSKIPSANAISSILAEFQAKAAQQQQLQMQQQAAAMDPTNTLLLAAAQNGTNPLAIQQLLAALNEKQPQQQQQQQFPFQMPLITNPMSQFAQQQSNGWMAQQVSWNFQIKNRNFNFIEKAECYWIRFLVTLIELVRQDLKRIECISKNLWSRRVVTSGDSFVRK